MTILAQVADSLRSKIAAEATIMRGHIQAAAACQERIDAMQARVDELDEVLAEQPLDLPIGGQPMHYASL